MAVEFDAFDWQLAQDYLLGDFVIMPNHVHALVQPVDEPISEIMAAWKSVSSHRINKQLSRRGSLWQAESFDHIVRDAQKLEMAQQYIRDNPGGLAAGRYRLGVGALR